MLKSLPNGGFRESESYSVETLGSRECGRQSRLFVGRCILAFNGNPQRKFKIFFRTFSANPPERRAY
jgi:hypothetical protein